MDLYGFMYKGFKTSCCSTRKKYIIIDELLLDNHLLQVWHGGALVGSVDLTVRRSRAQFLDWRLDVSVLVWVSSGCSSFLPQSKSTQLR